MIGRIDSIQDPFMAQRLPLAADYVGHFPVVQELFDYPPWRQSAWEERAFVLDRQSHLRANRTEVVDALRMFNRDVDNAPEALSALDQLNREGTFVVIGGQQACLFTGPLLTVYKAITVIRTARQASEQLQRPVVPVFWIAGEDHDFEEVNHVHYLDDLIIRKIKVKAPVDKRVSISHLFFDVAQWEEVLNQLSASLMETEFKTDIIQRLTKMADHSGTLVEFFARIMAWLFGRYGLVLMDSAQGNLRRIESPMFEKLIVHGTEINQELLKAAEQINVMGYTPQIDVRDNNLNLFVEHQGERLLLLKEGGDIVTKNGAVRFTEEALINLVKDYPENISNNVATRPIMQEFLFPVLGAVLGPGEIAYWGMLRNIFRSFAMEMPIVVPRLQFTIIEPSIQKQMQKLEVRVEDVFGDYKLKQQRWLEKHDALKTKEHFAEVKNKVTTLYGPLVEWVGHSYPGLRDLGRDNMERILGQINFLERRVTSAHQAQFQAAMRQFERIEKTIRPLGKPQDRVYNIFAVMNKFGAEWLDELLNVSIDNNGAHKIVYFN